MDEVLKQMKEQKAEEHRLEKEQKAKDGNTVPHRLWYRFRQELLCDRERRMHYKARHRTFLDDYFNYSSPYDYRVIRFLLCFPIGGLVAYGMFMIVWSNVALVDWYSWMGICLSCFLIFTIGCAFAWSPVFRCVLISALIGAGSKHGSSLMMTHVWTELTAEPLQNMITNFEGSVKQMICSFDTSANIELGRLELLMGPFMNSILGLSETMSATREFYSEMDHVVTSPTRSVLDEMNDDEKAALDKMGMLETNLRKRLDAKRLYNMSREALRNATEESVLGDLNKRLSRQRDRCHGIVKKSEVICLKAWKIFKATLYVAIVAMVSGSVAVFVFAIAAYNLWHPGGWIFAALAAVVIVAVMAILLSIAVAVITPLVMENLNPCDIIFSSVMKRLYDDGCNAGKDKQEDFNRLARKIAKQARSVREQLKVGAHVVNKPGYRRWNIHQPLIEKLKGLTKKLRTFAKTMNEIVRALMIFMIYRSFAKAYSYVSNYLTDIRANNHFLTAYFYHVDSRQRENGRDCLGDLRKYEIKKNKLKKPFSFPLKTELKGQWKAMMKFFFALVPSIVVVVGAHIQYDNLLLLYETGFTTTVQTGSNNLTVYVNGTGPVAGFVRRLFHEFNHSRQMNRTLSNEDCREKPIPPGIYFWKIWFKLIVMLFQAFAGYLVLRWRDFWVAGYIFPHRYKARILNLYNRLLRDRLQFMTLARTRVRYEATKAMLAGARGRFKDGPSTMRAIMDRLCIKTVTCTLCKEKGRMKDFAFCPMKHCGLPYCKGCWQDLMELCYACLAEEKFVTSARTQLPKELLVGTGEEKSETSTNNINERTNAASTNGSEEKSATVKKRTKPK